MAQRKQKVSEQPLLISNKFSVLYNYDDDDENYDKSMQNTTKKSDASEIHDDEAQDAEIEKRGKVVSGRLVKVSAKDHPQKNTKKK